MKPPNVALGDFHLLLFVNPCFFAKLLWKRAFIGILVIFDESVVMRVATDEFPNTEIFNYFINSLVYVSSSR